MQKKLFITGAGGYLGSVITKMALSLDEVTEVVAMDIFTSGKEGLLPLIQNGKLTLLKKDILSLSKQDFIGVDEIIHLASVVGTPACDRDPKEALRTNLAGTLHLIHTAKNVPIIFTNTNIGYPTGHSDETATLTPQGIYSQSKIEAEKVILEHGGISLRLGSVFGVSPKMRDNLLLNFLVKECVTKMTFEAYDMKSSRNFVHVKDVAIATLIQHKGLKSGEAYNFALPAHYNKEELLKLIEIEIHRKVPIKVTNKTDPDKRDYLLSMEKYKTDAKAVPTISIEEGIKELVQYYEYLAL